MASALDDIFGLSTQHRNPFATDPLASTGSSGWPTTFSATDVAVPRDPTKPTPVVTGPMPRFPSPLTDNTNYPHVSVPTPGSTTTPAGDPNDPYASTKLRFKTANDYLTSVLNSGQVRNLGGAQAVADLTNRIYGLPSGSGAAYYAAGVHGPGSQEIIGLPGGYFAHENNDPNAPWHWVDNNEAAGGGSSTNNDIYTNAVLSRLTQLGQPVDDPFRNLLLLSALGRAKDLFTKPPYTNQEDAALVAQYMNPLTQSRDALRQQATERAGQRGFLPSSGLLEGDMQKIDQGYERSVAGASNDLAVRAVQQRQANADQALSILGQVEQLAQTGRAEDRQRAIDLLSTAKLLPDFDAQKLDELLKASGSGSDATSFLNSLFGANNSALNASGMSADAWGRFLGALLNNPALMSSIFGNN